MVDLKNLVPEVQSRIRQKKEDEDRVSFISASANGLSVADSEKPPKTGDDGI